RHSIYTLSPHDALPICIGAIKEGQELTGNRTRVKIVKNKVAPPFKQAEFDVMYNEGISHTGLLIDLGVENDIVNKSGAWLYITRSEEHTSELQSRENLV